MECCNNPQHVLARVLSSTEQREQTTINGINSHKLYSVEKHLPDGQITASAVQLPEQNVYSIIPPRLMKLESVLNRNEEIQDFAECDELKPDESTIKMFPESVELSLPTKQDHDLVSHADVEMIPMLKTASTADVTRLKCDKCTETFVHQADLCRHNIECHAGHSGNMLQCDQCNKAFRYGGAFNRHMGLHQLGYYGTKCSVCDKVFSSSKGLARHKLTHSSERPFKCGSCGEGFISSGARKRHEYRHSSEQFKCTECDVLFINPQSLNKHVKQKHAKCYRTFQCPMCPVVYSYKYALKQHMKRHKGVDPIYACEECGKKFSKKGSLQSHMDTYHSSDKPYICQDCGKSYATYALLKQHARQIHSDVKKIKQFKCFDCGKAFIDKMRLTEHMNIHNGIKPFICEVCGKSFTRENNLSQHVVIHSDVKPFKCTRCDKAFSWKSHLTTHLKSHTGEKPHQCEQCDKCFTERSGLRLHMRSIHNTELPYTNHCIAEVSSS